MGSAATVPSRMSAAETTGQTAAPAAHPGFMAVPTCKIKCEKCEGGCKFTCACDDAIACATLQNLCRALSSGLCSICCTKNGICLCQCNFALCHCTCEYTKNGVCIKCTSGDQACCDIVQGCCDCIAACLEAGCTCCICFNNTPVCCCAC